MKPWRPAPGHWPRTRSLCRVAGKPVTRQRESLPSAAAPIVAATPTEQKQQHDNQDDDLKSTHDLSLPWAKTIPVPVHTVPGAAPCPSRRPRSQRGRTGGRSCTPAQQAQHGGRCVLRDGRPARREPHDDLGGCPPDGLPPPAGAGRVPPTAVVLVVVSAPPALMATFTASSIGSLKGTSMRSRPCS